jgi:RNA polymerase sigma-70 factor (ECF subfamily)
MYLVGRAQDGDREALDHLLERYQDRLRRIVRVRLGQRLSGHVEIMDIVQETCEVAARRIQNLELHSPASILHWLSRIAENKIHDAYNYHFAQKRDRRRDQRIDAARDDESTAGPPALQGSTTLPDERAWKKELREILDDALSTMPDDQREVILQRDYCGADWEQVAEALGRDNVHAAQELHRRAWIRLRRLVKPKLGGLLP